MKKYAKYLGLGVAAAGVIASVGLAYALYVKAPNPVTINIGTVVDTTADINYRLGDVEKTGLNESGKVDPDHNVITLTTVLGAAPKEGATLQPYVVGDLKVTVSGAAASIVTPAVEVTGFAEGKLGKVHYDHEVNKSFTAGVATLSNLIVAANNQQTLTITLTYDLSDEAKMLAAQTKGLNVDIEWGEEASFNYAYLVGTMTGWAQVEQYKYRMVPNLLNDASWVSTGENEGYINGFQWYYNNFTSAEAVEVKAKQGEQWSSGDNVSIAANTPTSLYWNGGDNPLHS